MKNKTLVVLISLFIPMLMSAQELTYSSEIQRKADNGNAFAQSQLGWCYEYGAGVEKDLETAYLWYRKAADQGDAYSMNAVAKCYWNGRGVAKDRYEALRWYEKAAHSDNEHERKQAIDKLDEIESYESCYDYNLVGHAEAGDDGAQLIIGTNFTFPESINSSIKVYDLKRGIQMLSNSEKQGNMEARHILGIRYIYGPDEIRDYDKGVQYLKKNVEAGYRRSMYTYGFCFLNGYGIEQNDADGIYWITQSAKKGYSEAMAYLGWFLEEGLYGLSRNISKAVEWYRKGSEAGWASAAYLLGRCYYLGAGVPKDFWKAINYFGQATNLGNKEAYNVLLEARSEMTRKFPKYLRDLKKKSAAGDGESQGILGGLYLSSDSNPLYKKYGIYYNPAEGVRLLMQSAKAGFRDSFYLAAMIYETGGIPKLKINKEGRLTLECGTGNLVQTDMALAAEYYTKCINSGLHDRWFCIIRMAKAYYDHNDRLVKEKDYARCVSLLNEVIEEFEQREASIELREAYLILSDLYRWGRGVKMDEAKADELLKKSVRLGDPSALIKQNTLSSLLQQQ